MMMKMYEIQTTKNKTIALRPLEARSSELSTAWQAGYSASAAFFSRSFCARQLSQQRTHTRVEPKQDRGNAEQKDSRSVTKRPGHWAVGRTLGSAELELLTLTAPHPRCSSLLLVALTLLPLLLVNLDRYAWSSGLQNQASESCRLWVGRVRRGLLRRRLHGTAVSWRRSRLQPVLRSRKRDQPVVRNQCLLTGRSAFDRADVHEHLADSR